MLDDAQMDSKMAYVTRPVVEIFPGGVMGKRKRSVSVDAPEPLPTTTNELKRRKVLPLKGDSQDAEPITPTLEVKKSAVVDSSRIRDTIESQFSLEILLKHNELRLINQELAKCQVALEQLRRCHLIPYPTTRATPESMVNITNGTGPAVGYGSNVPQHAPAYGVTDGPYTRHYSKWLIPDPSFDGVQVEWQRASDGSRASKSLLEGRSTRHSASEGMGSTSTSRSQRGSQGQKLQALSSGYPTEKKEVGPCVLKRGDGQTVKLVCVDCNRENFSSTQGFINHCRIAHRREFKSHEEAAITSGHPWEVDESGTPVENKSQAAAPSPVPAVAGATGLVHPLIRTTPTDPEAFKSLLNRIDTSLALFRQGKLPGVTSIPTSATPSPLKSNFGPNSQNSAPDAPNLSAWLRSKGFVGDLSTMVGEAKTKIDFEEVSFDEEESEHEKETTPDVRFGVNRPVTPVPIMRTPARAAMSPAPIGLGSNKGLDMETSRLDHNSMTPRLVHATPVINTSHLNRERIMSNMRSEGLGSFRGVNVNLEMMDAPSATEQLSPNTISSNNAPSLVSDDGEYDDGDDAESASSGDDGDSVAEIDIEDDGVDKVVPRTVLRNRAGSGGEMRMRKEDKHVTFMSPVKDAGAERRRK